MGEVVNWENRGHAGFHNFTGPGARSWVEEEALIGCLQYHTVEKTLQKLERKCVWPGLVGCLEFSGSSKSSGMQACLQTCRGLL